MKIAELMTQDVRTCRPDDSLHGAAKIMWDSDCGCVPVVGPEGQVLGMLTDRDICMAAFTQGKSLVELQVAGAMSQQVYSCAAEDSIDDVVELMRLQQIRRVPILDNDDRLVGVVSLGDIARAAGTGVNGFAKLGKPVPAPVVAQALADISLRETGSAAN